MGKPIVLYAIMLAWLATPAVAAPACDSNNGGLTLPAGFCAEVGSLYIVDNVKGKIWRVFHRAR